MRKESLGTSIIVILIISLTLITVNITSPTGPIVSVDPPTISKLVGSNFDINITVTNVTELYGWQFNLTFNPSVLNCTSVKEGPFLKQAGTTWWLPINIDNNAGFAFFGSSLFPAPSSGASGNGTLATMTFAAIDNDTSALHFSVSQLRGWDHDENVPVPISHTAVDGSVTATLGHDVAVVNITAPSVTYPNFNVTINATIKNEGSFSEKVNVTLRYNTLIGNETATIVIWQSLTVSFTWNTTGLSYGDYTLNATATVLNSTDNPGGIDDDLTNNNKTKPIEIRIPADVAAIDVIPAEDQAYPTWTNPLNITVTVLNNGIKTPVNFTVTAYYENVTAAYEIETQNVTNLSSGSQLNLTLSWNLTDVAWGLYTIKANVTHTDDINPANNEFVYSNVTIKIPGDIDGDGDSDGFDFGAFAFAFGSNKGEPKYDPEADIDGDGDIDGFDFGFFAFYFGKSTATYP